MLKTSRHIAGRVREALNRRGWEGRLSRFNTPLRLMVRDRVREYQVGTRMGHFLGCTYRKPISSLSTHQNRSSILTPMTPAVGPTQRFPLGRHLRHPIWRFARSCVAECEPQRHASHPESSHALHALAKSARSQEFTLREQAQRIGSCARGRSRGTQGSPPYPFVLPPKPFP